MILAVIVTVAVLIHVFYLIALLKKNFAVIDTAWGLGFVLISIVTYFHYPLSVRNAVTMLAVFLWGSRLASYLHQRNSGKEEDFRYAEMRRGWGKYANLKAYFMVFWLQGSLMLFLSLPLTTGMMPQKWSPTWFNWIGLGIFCVGLGFEAYADTYLAKFKKRPENKGKICTRGPWTICRFPNYLGEISLWYGLFLLNLGPNNWWTIICPVTLNLLILKVSGVPLLEKNYEGRADYREYSKRVPRLLPFGKPKELA